MTGKDALFASEVPKLLRLQKQLLKDILTHSHFEMFENESVAAGGGAEGDFDDGNE